MKASSTLPVLASTAGTASALPSVPDTDSALSSPSPVSAADAHSNTESSAHTGIKRQSAWDSMTLPSDAYPISPKQWGTIGDAQYWFEQAHAGSGAADGEVIQTGPVGPYQNVLIRCAPSTNTDNVYIDPSDTTVLLSLLALGEQGKPDKYRQSITPPGQCRSLDYKSAKTSYCNTSDKELYPVGTWAIGAKALQAAFPEARSKGVLSICGVGEGRPLREEACAVYIVKEANTSA